VPVTLIFSTSSSFDDDWKQIKKKDKSHMLWLLSEITLDQTVVQGGRLFLISNSKLTLYTRSRLFIPSIDRAV